MPKPLAGKSQQRTEKSADKEKVERKRKIDAQRQARLEGREAKKPKTIEAEKNSNYIKPKFDGDFGSIQGMARIEHNVQCILCF